MRIKRNLNKVFFTLESDDDILTLTIEKNKNIVTFEAPLSDKEEILDKAQNTLSGPYLKRVEAMLETF